MKECWNLLQLFLHNLWITIVVSQKYLRITIKIVEMTGTQKLEFCWWCVIFNDNNKSGKQFLYL